MTIRLGKGRDRRADKLSAHKVDFFSFGSLLSENSFSPRRKTGRARNNHSASCALNTRLSVRFYTQCEVYFAGGAVAAGGAVGANSARPSARATSIRTTLGSAVHNSKNEVSILDAVGDA